METWSEYLMEAVGVLLMILIDRGEGLSALHSLLQWKLEVKTAKQMLLEAETLWQQGFQHPIIWMRIMQLRQHLSEIYGDEES